MSVFEQRDVPVVIVGAGPTGVMLAIELARRGVQVRILDKEPARSQETRAIALHARTLELFHQIGVVEEFLELGHKATGMAVHTRARRRTSVDFGELDSPYPFVLMLGQDQTQRILDRRLERLGVNIERGVEVLKLEPHNDGVELAARRIGEQSGRALQARWVVGCDGAHSIVRRHLGVPFDGDDYGQDWLMAEVGIDWQMERERFHVFSYTSAPMVCFPMPGGRWRVIMPQVPNREGERQAPKMQEIERLAAMRGPTGMKLSDPTLLAAFRCYRRQTSVMRSGHLLVAGDAAHIHSPAGGQGMNTGLQDAANLAWKLALVVGGDASPALLDTYQEERHPIAAGVLAFTHNLVRVFTVTSSGQRWLRDRLLPTAMSIPTVERRFTTRMSQISQTYRGGPLASGTRRSQRASIAAGDRLPSVSGLVRAGKPLTTLDLLGTTAHTLLVFSGRGKDQDALQKTIAHIAPFNGHVHIVPILAVAAAHHSQAITDPSLQAHRRYHALRGALLLVRPDGYLACRAPLNRPDIPKQYLQQLTNRAASDHHTQLTPITTPLRTERPQPSTRFLTKTDAYAWRARQRRENAGAGREA
jgi:2-polyprenyl-6-methoxyphenol hydroxylase-like FAD-dependent oxidoreductase